MKAFFGKFHVRVLCLTATVPLIPFFLAGVWFLWGEEPFPLNEGTYIGGAVGYIVGLLILFQKQKRTLASTVTQKTSSQSHSLTPKDAE